MRVAAFNQQGAFGHRLLGQSCRPGRPAQPAWTQTPCKGASARVAAVDDPMTASASDGAPNTADWYAQFDKLLANQGSLCKTGDYVTGIVISVDKQGASIDIGGKAAAVCPVREMTMTSIQSAQEVLQTGVEREFVVIGELDNGSHRLSLKRMEEAVAWTRVRQLLEDNITVKVKVMSANRGGLLVEYMNIAGFIPSSHLKGGARADKEALIGAELDAKFLEVDQERNRLVFSNRKADSTVQMQRFRVGEVVEGTVTSTALYGAFLDIGGGVSGLLHISQISHDRIASVDRILSQGDKLKVMVLSQDRDRDRVSLSTKQLEPTPGDMVRDPQLVYERAEEMAAVFRDRVSKAEETAREEEARLRGDVEE